MSKIPIKLYVRFGTAICLVSGIALVSVHLLQNALPQSFLESSEMTISLAQAGIVLALTVAGSIGALHLEVGRYLMAIIAANRRSQAGRLVHPDHVQLPDTEISDLFLSSEALHCSLEEKEESLSRRLNEAEENLIKAAKLTAIGELTSTIVHDLRNPLQSILGYARLMRESGRQTNNDQKLKYLDRIERAANHIDDLVQRMATFGRHTVKLDKGQPIARCVSDSISILQAKIKHSNTKVNVHLSRPDLAFWGNKDLVTQILVNLGSNAIDAMEPCTVKELRLAAHESGNTLIVEVIDSGSGIPEEILGSIFSAFYTTKPEGKGTGLGLASCKDIANRLHAQISVQNNSQQPGATFRLVLQLEEPALANAEANQNIAV